MPAQAGTPDASQLEVSRDPAETAIIHVAESCSETAQEKTAHAEIAHELSSAALSAGMLVIDVSLLPAGAAPWLGSAAPGTVDGCGFGPRNAPNLVPVRFRPGAHPLRRHLAL